MSVLLGWRRRSCARRFRRKSRGGTILEFALVLPVLISLMMGMMEIGRAFMVANALTTAAREGARAGVVAAGDNSKVQASVNTALTNQGLSLTNLVTTIKVDGTVANASTAASGSAVSVSLSLPYDDVSWVGLGTYLGGKNLTAYAVMRRE